MDRFKLPGPLVLNENVSENLKKFKQKTELFIEAACASEATEKKKSRYI